ncbi:MAG: hypothetical protein FWC32_13660 [Firmicutes bacterium]|nr:hypothetical protein [Bacillota bacterium]
MPIQTLSIAAPLYFGQLVQDAGSRLQQELAAAGVQLDLNITLFSYSDAESHVREQYALFSMGQGADVFFATPEHPLLAFIDGGFLADINELIDTYSNRDYFFANVLEAFEIDGKLFTFPLNFAFDYVGINATLPTEFIERFAQYDTITLNRLAILYNELQQAYPELSHLAFGLGGRLQEGINDWINQSINWSARNVTTIASPLLANLRNAFYDNARHNTAAEVGFGGNPVRADVLELFQERYVFSFTIAAQDAFNALMDFSSPPYLHHIPIAGENGGLRIGRYDLVSVNAAADSTLAFAYLQHLVAAWVDSLLGEYSLNTPVKRELFMAHSERGFLRAMYVPESLRAQGTIRNAISRLEHYLEMPITVPATLFLLSPNLQADVMDDAMNRDMTQQQAAQEIRSRISYWLETGESLEVDREWLEIQTLLASRVDLPTQTISILAYFGYARILEQAAAAMNLAFAQRGEPYNFDIDITTFTWRELDAVNARFATLLMAGDGYDIIFVDGINNHPLWAWAESGLLTDAWTLIDAAPNVTRDDFYVNALEAFAHNGGLWGLPLSFGFEYVGINTSIPSSFIDRFAQFEIISVRELMELYLDLRAAFEDEIDHLHFTRGSNTSRIEQVVLHDLGSFVDFENRVSHLNSANFVSFLETVQQAYHTPPPQWSEGIITNTVGRQWNRNFADRFRSCSHRRLSKVWICEIRTIFSEEEERIS